MKNKRMQRMTYGFGISMAVLMVLSLFLPALTQNAVNNTQQIDPPTPTVVPVPTFPPPITDFSSISFEEEYLHPSGLFTLGIPTGWTPNQPVTNPSQAQITLGNPDTVSVIEAYITTPTTPIETADQLSEQFNTAALNSSWRQYTSANELARRVEGDRLLIDFELERTNQQFLARHVAWAEDNWIYVVRVVVPQNARDLMFFLLDAVAENFEGNTQFADTPLGWNGYFDQENEHILRHPTTWTLVDGGDGQPASFAAADGTAVQIETAEVAIPDETAARQWVENLRSGIQAQSIEPVSRPGGDGFAVAYTYTNPDGEQLSGKAVLLNGEDGKLHTANALLPTGGVDLNNPEDQTAFPDVTTSLETFSLLQGLNLPQPEPEPTPEPVMEVTPEATESPEVTASPDAEATDETEADGEETEATEEVADEDAAAEADTSDDQNAEATEAASE